MNALIRCRRPLTLLPILVLAALLVGAPRSARAGDITAGQQKKLDKINSDLKRLEANLKLAKEAAGRGTGRPKGSKAKLAMMRLKTAKEPLAGVAEALSALPADNENVQSAQQRYNTAKSAIEALEIRLTGKVAGPAKKETGVKLDYKQKDLLSNAKFSLRDLVKQENALIQLHAELKPIQDRRTIDYRRVQAGIDTLAVAVRRIKQTRESLAGLPADGRGVPAVQAELDRAAASVEASRQFLSPLHQELQQLINPANYPDLKPDMTRLGELSHLFNDPDVLTTDPQRSVEIIRVSSAAVKERNNLLKKYAVLIHQQTTEGKNLAAIGNGFADSYRKFAQAALLRRDALPGEIAAHCAEAMKWAREAVAEQKPLFFTGGIVQTLEFADGKLVLLEVLNTEKAAKSKQQVAQTRAEIRKMQNSLRQAIIDANEMPANEYAHGDREAIERLATKAWKKREPKAEILAIRIPSAEWKRSEMWRVSSATFYKVDQSKLQVQLIVAHDDKLAVIEPINLVKDHLSNDSIKAYPFHDKNAELQPQDFMLRSKVK